MSEALRPCICCANGNDLPEGEECQACGRVGDPYARTSHTTAPEVTEPLSSLQEALRKVGYRKVVPKQGYA